MADCRNLNETALGQLFTPARNNYFYGKLMDEFHFEMEQTYFNRKRWLLNRLALGSGVLCGLKVMVSEEDNHKVQIAPGVAIDALGREIIVPTLSRPIDPRQLTDECCRPSGEQAQDSVFICLAYHECESELVPVLVGECETEQDCAPSTICERYCVIVREDLEVPGRPTCPLPESFDFKNGMLSDRSYQSLVELISQPCPTVNGQPCVVLARISLPTGDQPEMSIDNGIRPLVYSNALLFELLLCVWTRLEECCREGGPVGIPVSPRLDDPPVVLDIWPPNSTIFGSPNPAVGPGLQPIPVEDWTRQPRLWIKFDREMEEEGLNDPSQWLRLWKVNSISDDEGSSTRLKSMELRWIRSEPYGGGYVVSYNVLDDEAREADGSYYLVQMRGEYIRDVRNLMQLDADFAGTSLSDKLLEEIWLVTDEREMSEDIIRGFRIADDTLPSGDREQGGLFHSWFRVGARQAPPAQPPVVNRVVLIGPVTTHELESLDGDDHLTEDDRINILQVTFSNPIDIESVTTITNGGEKEYEVSLIVRGSSGPVRGIVEEPADDPTDTIRFTTSEEYLTEGEYEVTLRGDLSGGPAIKDTGGLILDGDRHHDYPNKLPSGDGEAGGDLTFVFRIAGGLI